MDPNIIVTCPFDESHRITQSKLMQHITKCKAHANTDNMVECPLDKSHIVHVNKLKEHLASCSQLGKLVIELNPKTEQQLPTLVGNIESEENWDEEPEVPSYNPFEMAAEKKVLRNVSGLSRAQKWAFRDNERKRLANIRDSEFSERYKPSKTNEKSVRPPRSTSAVMSESVRETAKTSQLKAITNLSENSFCTNITSVSDISVQTLESSFKDPKASHNSELHNNIKEDNIFDESSYFQEPYARDSAVDEKKENFPTFDPNQTLQAEHIDEPEKILKSFIEEDGVANAATTCASNEPSKKNKLLSLLKNPEYLKELHQSIKNKNNEKSVENSGETGFDWDFNKFNERFAYLTDIQNAAAEESARLLSQLNNLKLRQDTKK